MNVQTRFNLFDYVNMDNDTSIKATITGIAFYAGNRVVYECSWFHNGSHCSAWIDERRLDVVGTQAEKLEHLLAEAGKR